VANISGARIVAAEPPAQVNTRLSLITLRMFSRRLAISAVTLTCEPERTVAKGSCKLTALLRGRCSVVLAGRGQVKCPRGYGSGGLGAVMRVQVTQHAEFSAVVDLFVEMVEHERGLAALGIFASDRAQWLPPGRCGQFLEHAPPEVVGTLQDGKSFGRG
jgi:hypothetical protein